MLQSPCSDLEWRQMDFDIGRAEDELIAAGGQAGDREVAQFVDGQGGLAFATLPEMRHAMANLHAGHQSEQDPAARMLRVALDLDDDLGISRAVDIGALARAA